MKVFTLRFQAEVLNRGLLRDAWESRQHHGGAAVGPGSLECVPSLERAGGRAGSGHEL